MKVLKIFVSYKRADASDFAQKIKEYYEEEGHKVFVDIVSIEEGTDWQLSIKNEIRNSDIVLVILTRAAL